jgi:4'-phosphopantetheinyl transferase
MRSFGSTVLRQDTGNAAPIYDNDVHVWCADTAELRPESCSEFVRSALTPKDRNRLDHLRTRELRRDFLSSRILLQHTRSLYRPCHDNPAAVDRSSFGPGDGRKVLCFSTSKTDGLVAVAVSHLPLGVDVERVRQGCVPFEVAEAFFSNGEKEQLMKTDPDLRPELFYRLWTLKEAYSKARGTGISEQLLKEISFALDAKHVVSVKFGPLIHDDPNHWHFQNTEFNCHFMLALTVRKCSIWPPRVTLRMTSLRA